MSERPILFSGPMVRALLDGRKTQTRRLITPSTAVTGTGVPIADLDFNSTSESLRTDGVGPNGYLHVPHRDGDTTHRVYPRIDAGDTLWVKETWAYVGGDEYLYQREPGAVRFRADHDPMPGEWVPGGRWRPSIFMPRWASRLTLRVEAVRVERLWDITEDDAIEEGCTGSYDPSGLIESTARDDFSGLWERINGKRAPWASNPWVWVVTFSREVPDAS